MITQSDIERERYEARRKAQLDYNTGMNVARREGEEIGQAKGEKIGQAKGEKIGMIHLSERLLNLPQTPTEQLVNLTLDELARLAADLEARLMKPR